jgi:uncharacterized FAD-dependent dehydrogenase
MRFKHFELGIRIEQPSTLFFLSKATELDPKLEAGGEGSTSAMRTFCCCRDGEVITTSTLGIWSVSGRADGPGTGMSNVGLNVRVRDEEIGRGWWNRLLPKITVPPHSPLCEDLEVFVDGASHNGNGSRIAELFGPELAASVAKGVAMFQSRFDSLRHARVRLWAPTIEGVGHYPQLDADLRVDRLPLWIAGDSSGIFRGLTAALVSGYYAGRRASKAGGS